MSSAGWAGLPVYTIEPRISVSARDVVDTVAEAALAAGGTEADGPEDHGFMYSRSFYDLDGHGWQVMWMDPAAAMLTAEPGKV